MQPCFLSQRRSENTAKIWKDLSDKLEGRGVLIIPM